MTLQEIFDQTSIIACCENPSPENVVSQFGQRISDRHVVKWAFGVTIEEALEPRISVSHASI